ncbi:MAG: T9SS type A sorting domain-containing protein [bacterium]
MLQLLVLVSGVEAQFYWPVTFDSRWITDTHIDSTICFTSVSCNGNNCTAAAVINFDPDNYSISNQRIALYRSGDGGRSWYEQPHNLKFSLSEIVDGLIKIQQIDSLNAVAIGDTNVFVRTSDGGITWELQTIQGPHRMNDIHFSNPNDGVICFYGSIYPLRTTSDGGKHWIQAPFGGDYIVQAHSYGNGKFRWFKYPFGPFYTTTNNFKTVDSTAMIVDSLQDSLWSHRLNTKCTFGNGDTILAYGKYWINDLWLGNGSIQRSIDGGQSWEEPVTFPTDRITQIDYTTSLDRDTIFAAGLYSNNYLLLSTDKGRSWTADTIITNTDFIYHPCFGLAMPADGHPIAIFSVTTYVSRSSLTKESSSKLGLIGYPAKIAYYTSIYPNPATNMVTIESIAESYPMMIVDMLGRIVYQSTIPNEKMQINTSHFPSGIYNVIINFKGTNFSAGKFIILGH